jgi:hypothetical protein
MLAEVVDAVVGVDTHRDVHVAEMASPTGSLIATIEIVNNSGGFARLVAWLGEHAPARGWSPRWTGPANTGSGCLARWPRPGCR